MIGRKEDNHDATKYYSAVFGHVGEWHDDGAGPGDVPRRVYCQGETGETRRVRRDQQEDRGFQPEQQRRYLARRREYVRGGQRRYVCQSTNWFRRCAESLRSLPGRAC